MRELHFRERYGLSVLAILREGQVIRSGLRTVPLRFGDALLLYGPRDRIELLDSEPGFIVLSEGSAQPLRLKKAPLAVAAMAAVLVPVLLGWLPISLAAILGATLIMGPGGYRFTDFVRVGLPLTVICLAVTLIVLPLLWPLS